jgi:imidazolonepropionase-like amidohydrolase
MIKILPSGGHGFPSTKGCRNFTVDELKAVTDAAHERGAWIRAHVNYVDQILECVDAGVDVLDHADEINDECIEAMARRGTHYCPTIAKSVMTATWNPSKPRYGFMDHFGYWPDNYIEVFGNTLRRAHKAGVKLLIGDDYGPGGGFKPNFWGDEINMFVNEFQFTPAEMIQIATANGAKFFGDKTGRVAPGKIADLLVLNFDPLKDGLSRLSDPASSIAAILKDGEFMKNELASTMSLRKAS